MTTTAGAAFPAVWAAFSTCEGAVCCPVRLIFRFLRCLGAELTRLLTPGFARLLGLSAPFAGPDGPPFLRQNASLRGPPAVKPNTELSRAVVGTNRYETREPSTTVVTFGRRTGRLAQRATQGTRRRGGSARMAGDGCRAA